MRVVLVVVGEIGLRASGGKVMGIGMKDGRVRAWMPVKWMCIECKEVCVKRNIPYGDLMK